MLAPHLHGLRRERRKHTILLRDFAAFHSTTALEAWPEAPSMALVRTDEGALNNGRSRGGLSKGDFGDDVGVADDRSATRTHLLAVILDDVGSRTTGIRAGCSLGMGRRFGLRLWSLDGDWNWMLETS